MERFLFETSEFPKIVAENINGSLRIKGWDRNTFRIDTDSPNSANVDQDGNTFNVNSKSGCLFRVPLESEIIVENVSGDLTIKSIENSLNLENINGQVILKSVGSTTLEKVKGNFSSKHIEGDLKIESANGNVMIRDVEGKIILEDGKGNFNFSGISGDVDIKTKGNANVTLELDFDGTYNIEAGGNIVCQIESTINANVKFSSKANSIRIDTRDQNEIFANKEFEINPEDGDCKIQLTAVGKIEYIELGKHDHTSSSFGFEHLDNLNNVGENLNSLADGITQQVSENLGKSINSITDQISLIMDNIGKNKTVTENARKTLKIKQRELRELTKAQRDVLRKSRKETGSDKKGSRHRRDIRFHAFHQEEKNVDPVSDEERQFILQMLQDKKIDINQAEELLAALEGKVTEIPESAKSESTAEGQDNPEETNDESK